MGSAAAAVGGAAKDAGKTLGDGAAALANTAGKAIGAAADFVGDHPEVVAVAGAVVLPGGAAVAAAVAAGAGGGAAGNVAVVVATAIAGPEVGAAVTAALEQEGKVYVVGGDKTPSGKPYVGRTKQPSPADRGKRDGRDRTEAEIVDTYDPSDPEAARAAEQRAINERGGIDNLDSKQNEIREEDWQEYDVPSPD